MNEQTIQDVAMIARNAIDKIIELERLNKQPTKLMVIPALMEAAGWVRKKEWVGLTEEEREGLLLDHEGYGILNYARSIEAKLKEKNT